MRSVTIDAVQGDAQCLPFRDGSVDLVHSSNVIEHLVDWRAMLAEMVRVLRPGTGVGYLSFSNWFSPWGGHETSPWHYVGGDYAVRRYERRYGRPPKNEYGSSLFRLDLAPVLRWFEDCDDVEVRWIAPRYLLMGARRSTTPRSRSAITAVAVNGFEIDATE